MPNALASDTPNPTYSRGRVCALTDVSRNSMTCKRRLERSCRLEAPPMSLEARPEDSPKCRVSGVRHPEHIHIQPILRRSFRILYNIHVDKSTALAVGDVIDAIRQPGPGNNPSNPTSIQYICLLSETWETFCHRLRVFVCRVFLEPIM